MAAMGEEDTLTLLDDEPGGHAHGASPWKILVTDDDPLVHETTQLALRGERIAGRPLELLHAASAGEAKCIVSGDRNIDLILLDVVMETEDAGLELVPVIREELHLPDVRIVIRTGQPGYAPEDEIRTRYAIDGYVVKAQLTRGKLIEILGGLLGGG